MMFDENDYLLISGIQHFTFCRRQWALIHIEQVWAENFLTAEGRLLHEKAHNPFLTEKRRDMIVVRDMAIHSSRLGVSGKCDIVEFSRDDARTHRRRGANKENRVLTFAPASPQTRPTSLRLRQSPHKRDKLRRTLKAADIADFTQGDSTQRLSDTGNCHYRGIQFTHGAFDFGFCILHLRFDILHLLIRHLA
jgi:hypothetical protein